MTKRLTTSHWPGYNMCSDYNTSGIIIILWSFKWTFQSKKFGTRHHAMGDLIKHLVYMWNFIVVQVAIEFDIGLRVYYTFHIKWWNWVYLEVKKNTFKYWRHKYCCPDLSFWFYTSLLSLAITAGFFCSSPLHILSCLRFQHWWDWTLSAGTW